MHACMHAYIHTYIHACVQQCVYSRSAGRLKGLNHSFAFSLAELIRWRWKERYSDFFRKLSHAWQCRLYPGGRESIFLPIRYGVHLQTANLFVTALREQVSADHPIRRFLTPFTSPSFASYRCLKNNSGIPLAYNSLHHLMAKTGSIPFFQTHPDDFRFRPFFLIG